MNYTASCGSAQDYEEITGEKYADDK